MGLFVGQNIITLQQVPSTNEYLKDKLSNSTPLAEGTVIMAVHQFAGRGQKGTSWHSEPGKNLTFSLLLTPTFLNPKHQFSLTVAISLAIAQWLESLLHTAIKVKWPNDIYIGDKKIGGILIENILKGKVWKSAVVGIGINVNQVDFPETFQEHSIAIKQILHKDSNIGELLPDLCKYIEREYFELKNGGFEGQLAMYKQYLYRLGEVHPFLIDGVSVAGVLCGVTAAGRLMIDFNGHVVDFDIKEVAFSVKPN
ncbi:biotin--[acetyl-CoA-carboxylase] ligase [Parapedobacter tibetensis]|uniref:biotin--[acetyl-CoA-carboxylase] ligase n=1 Tax=Parapedobacter tibetensis TaxID=2972951 RepID=UPI00214DB67B|nr:biotin--[acetyl-CoA-carboxylase] ligase [Parapedobacter tibetensis]